MQLISRHCVSARLGGPAARRNTATSRPRFPTLYAAAEAATAGSREAEEAAYDEAAAEAVAADNTKKAKVAFKVPHHVEYGQEMCVVGGVTDLGEWSPEQCVPMAWSDGDVWVAEAAVPAGTRVEYKYIVRAATSGEVVEWQPCDNLELALPEELVEAAEAPEGEPLVVVQDSWEGEQHSVKVGDTELAVPPPPEPAVEAPQEEEGKEEGALAQAAATEVVESSEVDTTLSVTTTEEEVAVFTMDALSAGIPIQGVEASAAASTNGTGKKGGDAAPELVLETLAAATAAVAASNGAAPVDAQEEEDDGLEDMTMNELKAAAKKAGINTFAAKRKDLITRLRALRASS